MLAQAPYFGEQDPSWVSSSAGSGGSVTDLSPHHSSSSCHFVSAGVLSVTPGESTPTLRHATKLVHKSPQIPQQTKPALPKKPQPGRKLEMRQPIPSPSAWKSPASPETGARVRGIESKARRRRSDPEPRGLCTEPGTRV